ncbi:hypothetical protein BVC80_8485g11 [Macleaya cordata]|uniref:Uncharacterized protein n=1 Tax=Macleaya cordata TaxID=56857 RepID=A0A200R163_MACCD|nr:hypothetical protein BVC80_8485g11 [Macleaya cordata]
MAGSEWDTSSKRHQYSLGMSRRTRKPMKLLQIRNDEDVADHHHHHQECLMMTTNNTTTTSTGSNISGYHLQTQNSSAIVDDDDHYFEEKPANDHQLACKVEGDQDHEELEAAASNHHQLAKLIMIDGDEEASTKLGDQRSSNRGGNSLTLSHHFIEEEKDNLLHNQLMVIKQKESAEGIKLGKMMKRYMKVLSHLIKVNKRDNNPRLGSQKKPLLQLTM